MQEETNTQELSTEGSNPSDINHKLLSDSDEIFNEELKADVATSISESRSIETASDLNGNSVPDAQWFDEYGKKLLATSSPITWEYHKSEIDNVNNIISSILSIAKWVSFSTIVLVAVFVLLNKDVGAIISGITGGIIDTILGVLTGLFNSTLKSKKSYFDSESDSTKFNKMLLLVQTITDPSKRDDIIVDILRKHFEVSNNK